MASSQASSVAGGTPVTATSMPAAPIPYEPDPASDPLPDRATLWRDVRETIYKLPTYFKSSLDVGGVMATDVFSFNTPLGATIEQQVVENLNLLRDSWDPNRRFDDYSFERQPQNFPDVVLKPNRLRPNRVPIMGIELKGWYALAKEGEPSFRYTATPAVCSDYDLLVVFPWALSNVISGSPFLFPSYVVPSK